MLLASNETLKGDCWGSKVTICGNPVATSPCCVGRVRAGSLLWDQSRDIGSRTPRQRPQGEETAGCLMWIITGGGF